MTDKIVTEAMGRAGCDAAKLPVAPSNRALVTRIYTAMSTAQEPALDDDALHERVEKLEDALMALFLASKIHDPDDWAGEPAMVAAWEALGRPK